ncbi:hypothetical protein BCR34DRAFT_527723 [Clohesyomyces aquaticus]|uniref:Prolyl 4-hydroxylase alpha subunit domain-containing protein n=1 Tax=Clohesyomyces aquaticus TaxID=1231657 RepID=A0A1Y2AAB0_9PLEO|nr:hypothetical protein BCR34DRAFT_527723 [Clohesyomyces aquaticus]
MKKQTQNKAPQAKMAGLKPKALFLALPLAIPAALWSSRVQQLLPQRLQTYLSASLPNLNSAVVNTVPDHEPHSCEAHKYTTEIVSIDPLVIYINNFTTFQEAEDLIKAGEADFEPSFISRSTGLHQVSGRTSSSAPLEPDIPLVSCILSRARTFMGSLMLPSEPFSMPQIVRYFPSEKYDLHTDFWPRHQIMNDGSGRLFNRPASFFVFLRDNCTQGETYFPLVDVLDRDAEHGGEVARRWEGRASRGEKDGEEMGVKFRPITGNAVFWINLDAEGKGDRRLVHAGLPVGEGEKIGMNLWPRKFYGWH